MKRANFAIVGATGNVGYATSEKLREAGASVRAVLRDDAKAKRLSAIGCDVAFADLQDTAALSRALADADAVQIVLPPPTSAVDALGDMRLLIESLVAALQQTGPKRVLVISDYGAHVEEWVGMPSVYRLLEERLRCLKLPKIILRSAEHMQGWAAFIPVAAATGILPSLHHPVESPFPTISAPDLGRISADYLLSQINGDRIVHAEGPRRYSATDVAESLAQLLGRKVVAQALPRTQWQESLERVLSASTAKLLVELYDAHNRGGLIDVEPSVGDVRYGTTELIDALRPFVPTP